MSNLYYGRHVLKEALKAKAEVSEVYCENSSAKEYLSSLNLSPNIKVHSEMPGAITKYNHQGIAFKSSHQFYENFESLNLQKFRFVILCNQLEDVHNLGSIARCAAGFGAQLIIHEKQNSAELTASAVKSSAGLAFRIKFCEVAQLTQAMAKLSSNGIHLVGLDGGSQSISLSEWAPQFPLGLVLGSEGEGLHPAIRKRCESLVRIPMEKVLESLNVSHAAAIAMSWAYQNRSL